MKKKRAIIEDNRAGFTIVELTLTMAFIGMLLIAIAIITTNILAIYQKGTTVKAVNNVGRGLIDNFTEAVTSAPTMDYETACSKLSGTAVNDCLSNKATEAYVYNDYIKGDRQLFGVFCTGIYSYIWNTAYSTDEGHLSVKYYEGEDAANKGEATTLSGNKIRLVRFRDETRRICSATVDLDNYENKFDDPTSDNTELNITTYAENPDRKLYFDAPQADLLTSNNVDLVLYELVFFPRSSDTLTGHSFYAGTFILGTERGNINIVSSNEFCNNNSGDDISETASSTGNLGAEFNYCAINKFNFAARTAGGKRNEDALKTE